MINLIKVWHTIVEKCTLIQTPPKAFKDYAELAFYLKNSLPGSDERMRLLMAGKKQGLLETSRFGASITVQSLPPENTKNEVDILNGTRLAYLSYRLHQTKDRAVKPDGIGPFGGRGDAGETPLITALREMLEEQMDVGLISPPQSMDAKDFIKGKLKAFKEKYEDTGITQTGTNHEKIRECLSKLKQANAVFDLSDDIKIDLKQLDLVPMDEAVDFAFPLQAVEGQVVGKNPDGSNIHFSFDTLQVTKPFMFVYKTRSETEFQSFMTDGQNSQQHVDKEAANIKPVSIGTVIINNRMGTPSYNPETDSRYPHEAFVASWIAAREKVSPATIMRMQPNPDVSARLTGVERCIPLAWLRRQATPSTESFDSTPSQFP